MEKVYQKSSKDVLKHYETSEEGLKQEAIADRQKKYGLNELEQSEKRSALEILWHNINNIIVYLLGAAVILSLFMGEWVEAAAVFAALLIAVLTGFFVELKAQGSVESLQKMIFTTTKVIRDGETQEIDSKDLVPGDIIVLEEGDAISADGRLITSSNFAVIESALTGESEPVDKDAQEIFEEEQSIGDRLNMVFSGTAVARGNAKAVVTGTGMKTEVGQISSLIDKKTAKDSPLEKELHKLGKVLIVLALVAAILVIVVGLINGQDMAHILHIAIILAIAAIPEALPAVSTITLSRGMRIMSEHKALVKSLSAVETLGSTTVIASDKTGTLTENQMTVERIRLAENRKLEVSGRGYDPIGDLTENGDKVSVTLTEILNGGQDDDALGQFIIHGLLASNAQLRLADDQSDDSDRKEYQIIGDPTEGSLVVLAAKNDLDYTTLSENGWKRLAEIPFSSEHKYMAVLAETPYGKRIVVKGAPDVLITNFIPKHKQDYWLDQNESLASEGMRVLAVASLKVDEKTDLAETFENNFDQFMGDFVIDGLAGIMDPPRDDVKDSVAETQNAGIAVKMITGDHPKTASVIAEQIGIKNHENTMTGQEIDKLVDQAGFAQKVRETAVFARVSPENKLQIVKSLQAEGNVVAMTGDGVNDAPALNGADIGVAMGIRGTEVAKETAAMILTDDKFSTIVSAVEIGRNIFANIKKYVMFLFSCNMIEILAVLLTIIFSLPMPLQALHILYLNLVIDIAPAMSLAFEEADEDIMSQPPRRASGGLVNKAFLARIIISGAIIALASFIIFRHAYAREASLEYAQTATFTFMALAQLLQIFNVRNPKGFGLNASFFKNKVLVLSLILSLGLQMAAIYLPFMNAILGTHPLTGATWGYMAIGLLVTTVFVYLANTLLRRYLKED
ncbi:cation-translocating P-type ATPase [Streptococcus moroccensis]|uniref:Ca2+-transporting ATPase n=1 Tax=Streptococcus moroccensis TaxID=1451356 RepID=A0ABT9YPM2_9STRE|nr:HAD-IC family P-type ATPase [Streptococcus moroccensis]MDQ0221674.1 Ca2+-transporting ATPase [Streptococcus moroccensis]